MGPIERELRTAPVENTEIWGWTFLVSDEAWRLISAATTMGITDAGQKNQLPDVLSDAIEFASAEGL